MNLTSERTVNIELGAIFVASVVMLVCSAGVLIPHVLVHWAAWPLGVRFSAVLSILWDGEMVALVFALRRVTAELPQQARMRLEVLPAMIGIGGLLLMAAWMR